MSNNDIIYLKIVILIINSCTYLLIITLWMLENNYLFLLNLVCIYIYVYIKKSYRIQEIKKI
jgi:hypothetical protein